MQICLIRAMSGKTAGLTVMLLLLPLAQESGDGASEFVLDWLDDRNGTPTKTGMPEWEVVMVCPIRTDHCTSVAYRFLRGFLTLPHRYPIVETDRQEGQCYNVCHFILSMNIRLLLYDVCPAVSVQNKRILLVRNGLCYMKSLYGGSGFALRCPLWGFMACTSNYACSTKSQDQSLSEDSVHIEDILQCVYHSTEDTFRAQPITLMIESGFGRTSVEKERKVSLLIVFVSRVAYSQETISVVGTVGG